MAFNTPVSDAQPEDKFYLPGAARRTTEQSRLERFLSGLLPEMDPFAAVSMDVPDFGFYLPGVRTEQHD